MPITYQHDNIPDLWTFDLSKDEKVRADELQLTLEELAELTDEVAAAVALFDFARQRVQYLEELLGTHAADRVASPQKLEQETFMGWQRIAAGALVSAVWRFEARRNLATTLAHAIPAIAALVDRHALKQSDRAFTDYFQNAGDLPPGATGRLIRLESDSPAALKGNLLESAIIYPRDSRLLRLEISERTKMTLIAVRDQFFAAFADIGRTLQEKHWQQAQAHFQRQFDD